MNKAPIPGWRTMTAAQRYNAKMDRIFEGAKDAQTRFNASSREDDPLASDGSAHVLDAATKG